MDSMDMSLSKPQETVKDRVTWCAAVHWGGKESDTTEKLSNNLTTAICLEVGDQGHNSHSSGAKSLYHLFLEDIGEGGGRRTT